MARRHVDAFEQDIIDQYGMMLNIEQAGRVLGFKDREATKTCLAGLPIYDMGRQKKYLARDIADRVAALRMRG